MKELFDKELELLKKPILELIIKKLSDGFTNRKGDLVIKIENVSLLNLSIDEKNSELRECIVVSSTYAKARVWVKFSEDSESSDNLDLMTINKINLLFNNETKTYYVDGAENVKLINR